MSAGAWIVTRRFVVLAIIGVALLALASCSGGGDGGQQAMSADGASRCLAYPKGREDGDFNAEELITNLDTNKRNVEGEILKVAAVKSEERVSEDAPIPPQRGKAIYFISINVGGRIATVAHTDLEDTGTPNGSGLWVALDAFSEVATHFPYDPETPLATTLRASLDTDGASESRACVGS